MTAEEIRKGLHYCADGNHGDGDLRCVTEYLADAADDCPDEELRDQVTSSIESMREALDMTLRWLDGKEPGLAYFRPRENA